MKLSDLLSAIETQTAGGTADRSGRGSDPEIGSIHCRAQEVRKGGLFIAIPGFVADGHAFIDIATANGAAAVLTEIPVQKDCLVIRIPNSRRALSAVASRFFGDPSGRLVLVAVTGTNGKTTVTYLIESMLLKAGFNSGVIGTIEAGYTIVARISESIRESHSSTHCNRSYIL